MASIRTRFAPSPTGYLHIGGARTALFNWLYARHHGGQFILRIEDTDKARSTPAATQAILEGMQWLGLDHDEGPFFQSERDDRYRTVIQQLLDTGHAYHCYCSSEELDAMREKQTTQGLKPKYDGRWRDSDQAPPTGINPVVRFKMPRSGSAQFEDEVHGSVSVENTELDDLVIARSDGSPTYNLTVVVDDVDMDITHIIRGDDHISNTLKQCHIYQALGHPTPTMVHIPMVLGSDGSRLSKRHGAVSVLQYQTEGYLPEALRNYLLRLGWSHGDQERFSRDEMIELFNLSALNKAPAKFDTDKLNWLNAQYLKASHSTVLAPEVERLMSQLGTQPSSTLSLIAVISLLQGRHETLLGLAKEAVTLYKPLSLDETQLDVFKTPEVAQSLSQFIEVLSGLEQIEAEHFFALMKQTAKNNALKVGQLGMPIRLALTGSTNSPSIGELAVVLGKTVVLNRLQQFNPSKPV